MNNKIKLRLVAGVTAVTLITGGYVLCKNRPLDNNLSSNYAYYNCDEKKTCTIKFINSSEQNEKFNMRLISNDGNLVSQWIQRYNQHTIDNLQPGKYTIECESEKIGFTKLNITISFDSNKEIYINNGSLVEQSCHVQENVDKYKLNLVLIKKK